MVERLTAQEWLLQMVTKRITRGCLISLHDNHPETYKELRQQVLAHTGKTSMMMSVAVPIVEDMRRELALKLIRRESIPSRMPSESGLSNLQVAKKRVQVCERELNQLQIEAKEPPEAQRFSLKDDIARKRGELQRLQNNLDALKFR